MLRQALEFHNRGDLAAAERLYGEILAIQPDHPAALHFLGVLAYQRGGNDEAIRLIGKALAIEPDNAFMVSNLGVVLLALRRFDEALSNFDRALALKPDYAEALSNRGKVFRELGRYEEGLASYDRALIIKPDYPDALYNRGNSLSALGRHDEAIASYDRALALTPDLAEASCNKGAALRHLGRLSEAMSSYLEALHIAPSHTPSWIGFSECLGCGCGVDEIHKPYLLAGLKNEHLNPQGFEFASVSLICRDPLMRSLIDVASVDASGREASVRQLEERLSAGELDGALNMPLLRVVLEECLVTSFALERLLGCLRHALLRWVTHFDDIASSAVERFASALALQCFANEYIYDESEEERRLLAGLVERLSQLLQMSGRCPPLWLKVAASYRPLSHLDAAADIMRFVDGVHEDAGLREIVCRQIIEPREEQEIRNRIPLLTAVDDDVSNAVRRQYEENPYPRWRRRNKPDAVMPLHAVMQALFPEKTLPNTSSEHPEILVAGCGTGGHPIQIARHFLGVNILAIDLSLASLAYAKRITDALGVTAIDYRRADILKLGDTGLRFDMIDSTGVLHHLQDPLQGWGVLADLLRPGGYMRVGLYSRRARRVINAARQFIAKRGFAATPEGIRACRRAIMVGEGGPALKGLDGIDFSSMSACRDMLFHVQEHQFSPIEIRDCVARLGLEFLGFELRNPRDLASYRSAFPDDIACDSLENWELFEEEHPDTFLGMLQFWVRKR